MVAGRSEAEPVVILAIAVEGPPYCGVLGGSSWETGYCGAEGTDAVAAGGKSPFDRLGG